jgi:superfamily II RNA helicase
MVIICNKKYPNESQYNDMFKRYPYELSDFQKYAIEAIIEGHHVLITAHTGSGKTLPAEFAIEYFVKQKKKVIYTSPIKALSNQKFYEFQNKYPHISFGLFTGDIKTNPEADVLIMTTEILMNALFIKENDIDVKVNTQFKIDINNELAAVVFDEVHYINDIHRGQTWEKTILMLPNHIQKIMLSATIDSPEKFANWCESCDNQSKKKVYLCSTNHRVVPLTHYAYITITESTLNGIKNKELQQELRKNTGKIIPIQTEKGEFLENGYKILKKTNEFLDKQPFVKRKYVLNNLCNYLKNKEMLPAIMFVFSRKNVELCAEEITIPLLEDDSKVPYIVKRECDQIMRKLPNYEEYLRIPEYHSLVSLLEKGVGIHHSGMIPILREIVELMISKKYIKVLFATESFAIGLDCPIRTAVFTGLQKFDGTDMRYLHAHEYTQMAGRAGRRGIDTIGYVIHCNNLFQLPTQTEYRDILGGKPQSLVSKFRISYSWVLNLFSSDGSLDNVIEKTKKSMIYEELQDNIKKQQLFITTLETEYREKKEKLNYIRTPVDICNRYSELEIKVKTAVNKKRKEIERELENIKTEYRYCIEDAKIVFQLKSLENDIESKEKKHLNYLKKYTEEQIGKVFSVLIEKKFICESIDGICLTNEGKMASKIAEIHPLIWTICICKKWDFMKEFTVKQMIGLFSCMTDIKVSQECKIYNPNTDDIFLKNRINELQEEYNSYFDMECMRKMRTGIDYENIFQFDIIEESMEWCDCSSEEECKWFIQTKLSIKEISIGDFTKAMMKIAMIAKELYLCSENVEWQYKLVQIDDYILKYIATSQSLYV